MRAQRAFEVVRFPGVVIVEKGEQAGLAEPDPNIPHDSGAAGVLR